MRFFLYPFFIFLMTLDSGLAFERFELLARAGQYDSFALGHPSYLSNTELELNDQGQLAFIYTGFDANSSTFHQRVGLINADGLMKNAYQAPEGYFLSKPSLNELGEVLVYQHLEGLNDGLWKISAEQTVTQVVSPKDFPEAQSFSSAQINSQGELFWRELDYEGTRSFVWFDPNTQQQQTLLRDGDNTHSYLFTPVINEQWLASKVRFGAMGDWSENRADQILVWNKQTEFKRVIARDQDDDANSPYLSFHNSVGLNQNGDVVFVATMAIDRKKSLILSRKGAHYEIAHEGIDLLEIETFAPMVNDQYTVAFRARDLQGKRSIFTWTPVAGLKKLISEGDLLSTDLQTGRVLDSSWGPGFSGQIALNNQNILVFTVVLESKEGEQRLGTAIYRTKI